MAQFSRASPGKKAKGASADDDDENVYVEETLYFVYDPSSPTPEENTSPRKHSASASYLTVEQLRNYFPIEVHKYDEDLEIEEEQRILKQLMDSPYADEEIDNILETLSSKLNQLGATGMIGEYLDNDIRFSENIREAIEEIKQMQRPQNNKSSELERRRFLQSYVETAEMLGVSLTVEHLLPAILDIFKQDDGVPSKEYVKLIFKSLDKLLDYLSSSEITVGYNGVRDYIMPMFAEFFQTERLDEQAKQDIQAEVIELLVRVCTLMTVEDRTERLLPLILDCIRDDSDEEKRILGLELVDKLAELLGKDHCQNFLMYEIISLQDDQIYRVRKETVIRMINISKVLGREIFLKFLFPVYKKLATDQIWGVRRSAVEILPQISLLSPIELKNGILIEMFKKFSQDSSKWVKQATFQYLGPFIATYEGIEPSPVLIDYYITMCEQNKSTAADNDVPYHCAYNFPAVLQTLGAKYWAKLHPVYDQLVKDQRVKVRRTLAFSLHEVARILGPEITEKELISVMYYFMKDVSEVKEGIVSTLPKFIQILSPQQRESYADQFASAQFENNQDWRKRVALAKQIRQFSKVFSAETVYKHYVPIFFQLCQDQVAEVRLEGARAAKNIVNKLQQNEDLLRDYTTKVLLFKESKKFNLRQTYIMMCSSIMLEKDLFEQYFLNGLCDLAKDRIINVRMELAEVISSHYKNQPQGGLVQSIKVLRILVKNMKLDSRDVSDILLEVNIKHEDEDFIDETEDKIVDNVPLADQEDSLVRAIEPSQEQVVEVNTQEEQKEFNEIVEKQEQEQQEQDMSNVQQINEPKLEEQENRNNASQSDYQIVESLINELIEQIVDQRA